MSEEKERTAMYKGRTYRLIYLGQTQNGRRARLQYWDKSQTFWVDASLIKEGDPDAGFTLDKPVELMCANCHIRPAANLICFDINAATGDCCYRCAALERAERRFA